MKLAMLCLSLALTAEVAARTQEAAVKSIELPADNPMAELKPGPGVETVRAACAICHSTDYIVRQPASDAKRWEGEVRKMITVFGAPISDADAKAIAEYLATAYGPKAAGTPAEREPKPR